MENQMSPIEQSEIRGMSFKTLVALLIATVSIVTTVLSTYFAEDSKIEKLMDKNVADERVLSLTIQSLQQQINALTAEQHTLEQRMNEAHGR